MHVHACFIGSKEGRNTLSRGTGCDTRHHDDSGFMRPRLLDVTVEELRRLHKVAFLNQIQQLKMLFAMLDAVHRNAVLH